ncbi:hypothetical protein BDA96_05G107500, partial [Sorghum bicolor]
RGDNNPCCKLLRAKYLGEGGFYNSKCKGVSQFWAGLHDIKQVCTRGLIYIVKNGKKARFWLDVWLGQCPLSIVYNKIFKICNEQNNTVHDVLQNNEVNLTFRRSFGIAEIEEWENMLSQVNEIKLQDEPDTVTWALEKNGKFTTASLYKALIFPGEENREVMSIWRAKIPMKIKFFLWSLYSDCLPSAEPLVKRNLPEDERSCVCWSLWLVRNDYAFNNKIISNPNAVIHRIDYVFAEVEHLNQGQGKRLDFEDGGKAIKIFGAKRPKLVT